MAEEYPNPKDLVEKQRKEQQERSIREQMQDEREKDLNKKEKKLNFLFKKKDKPEPSKENKSYLAPKKVLSKGEYEQYQQVQKQLKHRELRSKIKDLQKEAQLRRRLAKYEASRTGRFSKAITRGIKTISTRHGVTRALYRQQTSPDQKFKPQRIQKIQRFQQPQQPHRVPEGNQSNSDFFDWVFSNFSNPQFNVAHNLEKEVSSVNGEASMGDRMAMFNVTEDINRFANLITNPFNNPLMNVNSLALHHSKNIIFDPFLSVNSEADFFSNIIP